MMRTETDRLIVLHPFALSVRNSHSLALLSRSLIQRPLYPAYDYRAPKPTVCINSHYMIFHTFSLKYEFLSPRSLSSVTRRQSNKMNAAEAAEAAAEAVF